MTGQGSNEKVTCNLSPLFQSSLSIGSSGIDSLPASPMTFNETTSVESKVKSESNETYSIENKFSSQTEPNLEESLHQVMELLHMALNNRFQEALEVSEKW